MFGLMKARGCSHPDQPNWYRLHYCGTCKTIGKRYGQQSRLALNHDTVFLAEILSLIRTEQTENWSSSLHGHACFQLPEENEIPLPLQYAADMNTLLATIKLRDDRRDRPFSLRGLAGRIFDRASRSLPKRLQAWNIDMEFVEECTLRESRQEAASFDSQFSSVEESLSHFAAPSARLTGYLFAKGVAGVGHPEWKDSVRPIGEAFGHLIYCLDAWRDYHEDVETLQFNPLCTVSTDLSDRDLLETTEQYVWTQGQKICSMIQELPMEERVLQQIQSRLQLNLSVGLQRSSASCESVSTGIERSTVPQAMRKLRLSLNFLYSWITPTQPARFMVGYAMMILLFFQQQIASAAIHLTGTGGESASDPNWWLIGALGAIPGAAILLARNKDAKSSAKRWKKKIERKNRRLKKRLAKLLRQRKEGEKLKWWAWVLIILGGALTFLVFLTSLLFLILFIAVITSSGDCGSVDCSGVDTGCDPDCDPDCTC